MRKTSQANFGTVAGVDGCRGGWFVVLWSSRGLERRCVPDFTAVLKATARAAVVVVDMPIGLLDNAQRGGRDCDRGARSLLGRRHVCVFSPPVRAALAETTYQAALAANRASSPAGLGISPHCFGLFEKLRQVDGSMTPDLQRRVVEGHPELSFYALNGDRPMEHGKHSEAGKADRCRLLTEIPAFGDLEQWLATECPRGVAYDDAFDAHVLAWTAARSDAVRLPAAPPRDGRDLLMEIRY